MAIRELVELLNRVNELERRVSGLMRHGTVHEVDPAKQVMRLRLGDDVKGQPFLSPWIPYAQIAGALKVHTPPSVGQQYTAMSPTGDWQQAVGVPLTWSNDNPSPSDKGDEHVLTFGQVKVTIKEQLLQIEVGSTKWELIPAGFRQTGGGMEHDGHLIDETHRHTDVMPGAALTGPPDAGSI